MSDAFHSECSIAKRGAKYAPVHIAQERPMPATPTPSSKPDRRRAKITRSRRRSAPRRDETEILPTRERFRRDGGLERTEVVVTDDQGVAIGRAMPFRGEDILLRLLGAEKITVEQARAGVDFRSRFRRAHLDELHAADVGRLRVHGYRPEDLAMTVVNARRLIWRTLEAVGGPMSDAGSILWGVLGLGWSLRRWRATRRIRNGAGTVILVRALARLAGSPEAG
jgi:hypothetical protein